MNDKRDTETQRRDSRLSGFHRKRIAERIETLVEHGFVAPSDARRLESSDSLIRAAVADIMVENVISVFGLPFAVAPNFLINGRNYVAPMVVEEPSVVAGVSGAARLMRHAGGFEATTAESLLTGQVHLVDIDSPESALIKLQNAAPEILKLANDHQPRLLQRGGGARTIEFHQHRLPEGSKSPFTIVAHIAIDTCDAMGANLVNSVCEFLAPTLEEISGGRAGLCILSNLADRSLVTATVTIPLAALRSDGYSGEAVRDGIVLANDFATVDRYRATTHNKGIMNGVDAVAIATGNDWRAIEASAHAYASRDGQYRALTAWRVTAAGDLRGELTLPLKVGIVGGSLQANPAAAIGLRIAAVASATELAELICCAGLAQNFAALRALVTGGIQKGHMSLHARSVASVAGAAADIFDDVVAELVASGEIKEWKAKEIIAGMRQEKHASSGTASAGHASGKVILFGEHAAVYGRHALAVPLPRAMTVSVRAATSGTSVRAARWNIHSGAPSWASSLIGIICRGLGVKTPELDIDIDTRLPMGMGLGSSAALAVALTRAIGQQLALHVDDETVNRIAFDCEKIAHHNPSGIDNTLACYGTPLLFRSGQPPLVELLELTEPLPLVVACSSTPGPTAEQVAGVRARYDKNSAYFDAVFDQIDALSRDGAAALLQKDYARLGSMMNICQGLLNAIGVSTPELESMISIARDAGALGAKLTGAGGGGSIIALCPGKVAEVDQALCDAGFRTLALTTS